MNSGEKVWLDWVPSRMMERWVNETWRERNKVSIKGEWIHELFQTEHHSPYAATVACCDDRPAAATGKLACVFNNASYEDGSQLNTWHSASWPGDVQRTWLCLSTEQSDVGINYFPKVGKNGQAEAHMPIGNPAGNGTYDGTTTEVDPSGQIPHSFTLV